MARIPVSLLGLTGIAFLVGSFAPAAFGVTSYPQPQTLFGSAPDAGKGDRVAEPRPAVSRTGVSIVEIVGVSKVTLILKDEGGRVLYRSDPQFGITTFAKNTDLPVVTISEKAPGGDLQAPTVRQEEPETPAETKPKQRNPVGCLRDVSPLAKASANRSPSLCLAYLDRLHS